MKKIYLAKHSYNTGSEKGNQYATYETLEAARKDIKEHFELVLQSLKDTCNEWYKEHSVIERNDNIIYLYETIPNGIITVGGKYERIEIVEHEIPIGVTNCLNYGVWCGE